MFPTKAMSTLARFTASIVMRRLNATTKLRPTSPGSARLTGSTNTCVPDFVRPMETTMPQGRIARDGGEFAVRSNGGDWLTALFSPPAVPTGTAHGANGFCVTADDHVVLISRDGERWGWPGGRPEGDESWEQTLRREILEETCSLVRDARLLGSCRGVCLTGPEKGLVL